MNDGRVLRQAVQVLGGALLCSCARRLLSYLQLVLEGLYIETLAEHGAAAHVLVDPIPAQVDVMLYDNTATLPMVEVFVLWKHKVYLTRCRCL